MDVALKCTLEITASALTLTYRLHNPTLRSWGVFNRIGSVGPDGLRTFSPNTVFLDADSSILHASKMALKPPPNLKMTVSVSPNVSSLPSSATLQESVVIPLPVTVMHPHRRALMIGDVIADAPVEVTSIMFAVGLFPLGDDCHLMSELPAHPDVLTAFPPGVAIARQVVVSETLPLRAALPVLTYRSVPWSRE